MLTIQFIFIPIII